MESTLKMFLLVLPLRGHLNCTPGADGVLLQAKHAASGHHWLLMNSVIAEDVACAHSWALFHLLPSESFPVFLHNHVR